MREALNGEPRKADCLQLPIVILQAKCRGEVRGWILTAQEEQEARMRDRETGEVRSLRSL